MYYISQLYYKCPSSIIFIAVSSCHATRDVEMTTCNKFSFASKRSLSVKCQLYTVVKESLGLFRVICFYVSFTDKLFIELYFIQYGTSFLCFSQVLSRSTIVITVYYRIVKKKMCKENRCSVKSGFLYSTTVL